MMRKKAIKTKTTKKTAKKKSGTKKKKQIDAAAVRAELAGMVKSGAKDITEAVMDQAMHGELAPAKFLLEMAGVYPPVTDGSETSREEDCLAKTLLDRLNIPDEPVGRDEDEDYVTIPANISDEDDEQEGETKQAEAEKEKESDEEQLATAF